MALVKQALYIFGVIVAAKVVQIIIQNWGQPWL
jgi:hypothetical protein